MESESSTPQVQETKLAEVMVLFGMSFERDPDRLRIFTMLNRNPQSKILSISMHPRPEYDLRTED